MALTFTEDTKDTIAAIATGLQESGIGIIRISGPEAFSIADRVYRNKRMEHALLGFPANTIHFGYIVEEGENGESIIDEVMVSVMRHPQSYTTEDTVEINTHGGIYLMKRVLDLVLRNGCRLAQPGEFTKRAFLGGRIDLAKAESVMNLIQSQNERARAAGIAGLEGKLSLTVKEMRSAILYELAFIESALDDPENYVMEERSEEMRVSLEGVLERIKRLIAVSEEGKLAREGVKTVIIGKPNVGKSTLMNLLSGEERAIVTRIPGTTRDVLEERVKLGDVVLRLTDTAGVRDTSDEIEKIGIERTLHSLEDADLIFFLLDLSEAFTDEDVTTAGYVRRRMEEGSCCIVLGNKMDLLSGDAGEGELREGRNSAADAEKIENRKREIEDLLLNGAGTQVPEDRFHFIPSSVKYGRGLDEIREIVRNLADRGNISLENEGVLANVRQLEEMRNARNSLEMVCAGLHSNVSEDLLSVDLMNAYTQLGRIIGESVEDDLVEEIFSKFCMGK